MTPKEVSTNALLVLPHLSTEREDFQLRNITFDSVHGEHFKGLREVDIPFGLSTVIKGMNGSGKTSVLDLISWIVFDKDSKGNSKFEVRTLDASGQKIHHTEIVGILNMTVDGVEYEVKKTQKEKWVKKRGQEQQEFSGNQNLFEINGFPKSDKEYKAFIASIIDEDIFKLLTNPMAFPAMDWKKQRELLMRFVSDVTPEEVAESVENFDLIAPDIAVASVDDCKKKYTKAKKELKSKQETIPVRIDELEKSKIVVDTDALNEQATSIQAKIDVAENELKENPVASVEQLNEQLLINAQKLEMLNEEADRDRKRKYDEAKANEMDIVNKLANRRKELAEKQAYIAEELAKAQNAKKAYDDLGNEFAAVKAEQFDESQNVCKYCGQALPEGQQKENRNRFIKIQQDRKDSINKEAVRYRQINRCSTENAKQAEEGLNEIKSAIADLEAKLVEAEAASKIFEVPADASGTDEYKKVVAEQETIKQKIADRDKAIAERSEKEFLVRSLRNELRTVQDQLASVKVNEGIDARIAELREELRSVSQKLADSDRLIFVLENYVKFLADKINDRFEGLEFKLFSEQINGGIKECCEITYNGVPYSDLNSGHRIVVGLEIIKTLQELYDVKAPVFIDNSETLNEFNMPKMDCQVVALKVSDDKELVIS